MKRIDREDYYMRIALLARERGTCPRAQVGAVAVKDKRIIATGFNGSPIGTPHCDDVGCYIQDGHCVRSIHAEQNIITQCAMTGTTLKGATIYVTHEPCFLCVSLLINCGVKKIVFAFSKADDRMLPGYYTHIEIEHLLGYKDETRN